MNFKLKTLAVAVALAAVAGQASATTVNALPATGTTGLLFFAIDGTNSFVMNLGQAGTAFLPGASATLANQSWSMTGADWSSYTGAADLASTTWGVVYGQGNTSATYFLGSTATAGSAAGDFSSVLNSQMVASRSALSSTITAENAFLASGNTHFTAGTGNDNWVTLMGDGMAGNYPVANAIGESGVAFYQYKQGVANVYAGTFGFDGTSLSYTAAAVPEPETYGMLTAGLLLMGAVARRRKA